jgi:2-oxoglutarate ferredoxin oxidoreductase subunit gamma
MIGRVELLISGRGGQGVVRLGQIVGLAAIRQGRAATMLVSHGTETRGGYVRSQVVLAERFVDSPVVERADCFCAMSQEAYDRFKGLVSGTLVYDPEHIVLDDDLAARRLPVPASSIATGELGNGRLANAVFLGAATRVLEAALDPAHVTAALAKCLPRFQAENRRGFELGWESAKPR